MAYINVSIDIESAVNQIAPSDYNELFNALGNFHDGDIETVKRAFDRHLGSELDDDGKAFLKACRDWFDAEFPGE